MKLGEALDRPFLNKAHPFKRIWAELIDGKLCADSPIELGWWFEKDKPGLVPVMTIEEVKLSMPEADNDISILIELLNEIGEY